MSIQRCQACNAANKGRDYCGGCGASMTQRPDTGVEHVRDELRVSDEALEYLCNYGIGPEGIDRKCALDLRDARTANRQLTEALAARTAERDEAWAYIRKATLQLTDFVGGGSELFSGRMGVGTNQEFFPADIDFCFQRAWESRRRSGAWMDAREAELANARADRAEAQLAAGVTEEMVEAAWAAIGMFRCTPTDARRAIEYALAARPPAPTSPAQPGKPLSLAECPVGLFLAPSGGLCLKTEYGTNEGRINAYIVSSGEMFWGAQPQTIQSQRKQLVIPVDENVIANALRDMTPAQDKVADAVGEERS